MQPARWARELVLKVRNLFENEVPLVKPGSTLVGMLNPFDAPGLQRLAAAGHHRIRAGSRAAHHARSEHGRALVRKPTLRATRP